MDIGFWILIWTATFARGYNIRYYDCTKPSAIYKYQTSHLCKENEAKEEPKSHMSVLQRIKNKSLSGHSCQIIRSAWTYYCGVYSHSKIAEIPQIEVTEGLSPNACNDMVNSLKLRRHGQSYKLSMNGETVIRSVEAGMIKDEDNSVSCKGITQKINDKVIDNILIISQTKVILKEESLTISGSEVEVLGDHLTLPCKPADGGCRTMEKTFVWSQQMTECPLRKVRDLQVKEEGDYWVDESANVVLKRMSQVAAPAGCPTVILYTTEYEDVFVTSSEDDTFEPLGENMLLPIWVACRDDFIVFEMERKLKKLRRKFSQLVCDYSHRGSRIEGDIVKLDDANSFGLQSGETTYIFACEQKQDKIREETHCFQDIPIGEDPTMFVTPNERVMTRNSKRIPCNTHFPITVRSEQCWLELRPQPTPISDPDRMPIEDHLEGKHLDMSAGGLYTQSEITSWEHHIEFGQYHKSILHQISNGVWNGASSSEPGYSLSNLLMPGPLTWFETMKKQLEEHTAVLCAIVLLIEACKFLTTIAMLGMALIREGISGLLAVLALLLCPAQQTLAKIRRRAKRNRAEKEPLNGDDETQL